MLAAVILAFKISRDSYNHGTLKFQAKRGDPFNLRWMALALNYGCE